MYLQKLYDGTLLCFAEAAREVWPELDSGFLSDTRLFEDDNEKAEFMELARRLIGSVRIDKPDDITYWVNKDTLAELLRQDGHNPSSRPSFRIAILGSSGRSFVFFRPCLRNTI